MGKKLVVYFSASGVTKNAAEKLAKAADAHIFELRPTVPYTRADLNWMDKNSRSSREMNDAASRPEIAALPQDMSGYDTVFIGFPIWWYTAPRIIETFLDSCDLSGKTVVCFATSGGSTVAKAEKEVPRCRVEKRQDAQRCIRQRHRGLTQPALRFGVRHEGHRRCGVRHGQSKGIQFLFL